MNVLIDNECYFHVWMTKGTYSVVTPEFFWDQMGIKGCNKAVDDTG